MTSPAAFYFHAPFCTGRCTYCSFHSGPPPTEAALAAYLDGLTRAFDAFSATPLSCSTLYFGGGTPGLIGSESFRRWHARFIGERLLPEPGFEWTVELHPATATPPLLNTLRALGTTRLSIGVQALDDAVLLAHNRRHTADCARRAVALAREAGFGDVGIDLIAGLPGVTLPRWEATLREVAGWDLRHLSIYTLSIDPGSALAARGATPPSDGLDEMALAAEMLSASGLLRYETSNFARPGHECRHNLAYWRGCDYLGLGPGAASRLGLLRRTPEEEILTPLDDALERTLTRLRTAEGFSLERALGDFPVLSPFRAAWARLLTSFCANGLLFEPEPGFFAPTPRGHEVGDGIIRELLTATKST